MAGGVWKRRNEIAARPNVKMRIWGGIGGRKSKPEVRMTKHPRNEQTSREGY